MTYSQPEGRELLRIPYLKGKKNELADLNSGAYPETHILLLVPTVA